MKTLLKVGLLSLLVLFASYIAYEFEGGLSPPNQEIVLADNLNIDLEVKSVWYVDDLQSTAMFVSYSASYQDHQNLEVDLSGIAKTDFKFRYMTGEQTINIPLIRKELENYVLKTIEPYQEERYKHQEKYQASLVNL